MSFMAVNWLAVVVATVTDVIAGFLWYGPLLDQMWLRMVGERADEIQANLTMCVMTVVAALF